MAVANIIPSFHQGLRSPPPRLICPSGVAAALHLEAASSHRHMRRKKLVTEKDLMLSSSHQYSSSKGIHMKQSSQNTRTNIQDRRVRSVHTRAGHALFKRWLYRDDARSIRDLYPIMCIILYPRRENILSTRPRPLQKWTRHFYVERGLRFYHRGTTKDLENEIEVHFSDTSSTPFGADCECRLEYILHVGCVVGSVVDLLNWVVDQKHEARPASLECCCVVLFLCDCVVFCMFRLLINQSSWSRESEILDPTFICRSHLTNYCT